MVRQVRHLPLQEAPQQDTEVTAKQEVRVLQLQVQELDKLDMAHPHQTTSQPRNSIQHLCHRKQQDKADTVKVQARHLEQPPPPLEAPEPVKEATAKVD